MEENNSFLLDGVAQGPRRKHKAHSNGDTLREVYKWTIYEYMGGRENTRHSYIYHSSIWKNGHQNRMEGEGEKEEDRGEREGEREGRRGEEEEKEEEEQQEEEERQE